MMKMKKRVYVLATGGTIASRPLSATSTVGYAPSVFTVEDLLESVPGIEEEAQLTAEQIYKKQSPNLTDEDLIALGRRVQQLFDQDQTDGVVITMGTDTMEEVAYFLHLTLNTQGPVVITGAMRPAGVISSDGPMNIRNAVLVAASDQSRGKGVLVSMDDHILSGRDVMKCSSFKTDSFRGGDYGVIGSVRNGTVHYFYQSVKRHTLSSEFDIARISHLPLVEVLYMFQGCSSRQVEAAVAYGAEGIVTAGFGNGAIHLDILDYYRAHKGERLPVLVRACRAPYGGTEGDYGHFDEEIGSLPSNDLTPQKARILLSLALACGYDRREIIRVFAEY